MAVTGVVEIVNFRLEAPSGTVAVAGRLTAGLVLVSMTTAPFGGAGASRVIRPVIILEPGTVEWVNVSEARAAPNAGVVSETRKQSKNNGSRRACCLMIVLLDKECFE